MRSVRPGRRRPQDLNLWPHPYQVDRGTSSTMVNVCRPMVRLALRFGVDRWRTPLLVSAADVRWPKREEKHSDSDQKAPDRNRSRSGSADFLSFSGTPFLVLFPNHLAGESGEAEEQASEERENDAQDPYQDLRIAFFRKPHQSPSAWTPSTGLPHPQWGRSGGQGTYTGCS